MRYWLSFIALFLSLFILTPSYGATYCLRNDGSAGSKTAATDCLTVGNCMNETVHNGESFAGSDVILVCPHGGDFNSQVTTPSNGGSGTEITYNAVYDSVLGWPVFDEGFSLATNYIILRGVEIRPGIAESGTATFEGGRFAATDRTWEEAEETAVTSWDIANVGIYAVGIGATGGGLDVTPQLYWRDKTDTGSFAAVGAAGEVKYVATSALTDDGNLATGNFGTSSGKAAVIGAGGEQEDSHQASSATTLVADEFTELQVGVSFADADPGHEYEFSLYHAAAQIGSASAATVTVCDPACNNSNITIFHPMEDNTMNTTADCVSGDDLATGDSSATTIGTAAYNADAKKVGANGLDCPAANDRMQFDTGVDTMFDSHTFRMGFWLYTEGIVANGQIFNLYVTTQYVRIAYLGSDDLRLQWYDNTNTNNCDSAFDGIAEDTWYWVEVHIDRSAGTMQMWIDNTSRCSLSGQTMVDFTPNSARWGSLSNAHDLHIDNAIVSSDEDTSLWSYRDDTDYNTCN
jgi:hypothetical protein